MSKKKNKKEEVQEEKKKGSIFTKIPYLILLIILVIVYARYIGTRGIKVRDYNIINENIPKSFDGFSIVQFSDLKIGSTFNISDLDNLVKKINDLKPDVVVFTGDISASTHTLTSTEEEEIGEKLALIDPLIGKYAVRGDTDNYTSYDVIMSEAGFEDLTNTYKLVYYKGLTPIVIYGLDSLLSGNQNYAKTFAYPGNLEDTTYMATYRILLTHEPDTVKNIGNYNISLMLSGHSHNSEINIPILRDYYNIKGASDYYNEKYNVNGTKLYISSGLGTSKYKMRLFSKPSISVFRLYTN